MMLREMRNTFVYIKMHLVKNWFSNVQEKVRAGYPTCTMSKAFLRKTLRDSLGFHMATTSSREDLAATIH